MAPSLLSMTVAQGPVPPVQDMTNGANEAHIVSRFNITLQIVSVIFQIVHVATVAAVQLA